MITCPICLKQFHLKPYRIKRVKNTPTCSKDCSNRLKSQYYLGQNNPNFQYKKNENLFEAIDDEFKAYILGFIASDGCLFGNRIVITIHKKDIDILEKIRNYICKDIPIKRFIKKNQVSLTISSKKMVEDINKLLDIPKDIKKSNIVKYPFNMIYHKDFIRGFFDGDGHINDPTKNKKTYLQCGITSNSSDLLDSIKTQVNIQGYRGKDKLEWSCNKGLDFLDYIYYNSNIYLDRKYNLYQYWKNK